jgi:hypothetical protein
MTKYVQYLYMAGQYAGIIFLLGIIGVTIFGWAAIALTGAPVPTLVIGSGVNSVFNGVLLTLPALFAAIQLTFVPSAWRVLRLERSHREFRTGMNDIEEAYYRSHSADRAGTYRLTREFDAVMERARHLQSLPDLHGMEPDILILAAQMSYMSRDIAAAFNDEKVAAAKEFISKRLTEAEQFETQIEAFKRTIESIRADASKIHTLETDAGAMLEKLVADWTQMQQQLQLAKAETNVVAMVPAAG